MLGWLLVVVGVAVLGSVLVSRQLLLADVNRQLNAELSHEASKFRAFAASNIDPSTGRRYSSAGQLLAQYLQRNLPEGGEAFFSVVGGRPDRRSPGTPDARLDRDRDFIAHIRSAIRSSPGPVSGNWNTSAGEAAYAVLPVRLPTGGPAGALVVVEFRRELQDQAEHMVRLLLLAALASLAVAGVVGWLVAGRVLAPVRAMRRTAERINGSDLTDRIEVTGTDDVAGLARTFNSMLDRLESAFTGQRQFLDDAGHELRTPITIIRGHLELMGTDPVERAATVALVLDELDRMARIVDDLILLAKAERPDFLTLGEVDLGDLAMEALSKAQALGDRRWRLDGFGERTIVADGQRLTQALMQLAANATRHTRRGDTIALGTAVDAGDAADSPIPDEQTRRRERVRLWVRDTGDGIAEDDQDRIFDRFYRGASRTHVGQQAGAETVQRTGEGAGLGLTIVARIAAAHHGYVQVASAPGQGATFTLNLPLIPVDQPGTGGRPTPHDPAPAVTRSAEDER